MRVICPVDEAENEDRERCRQCSADLGPIIRLEETLRSVDAAADQVMTEAAAFTKRTRRLLWALPVAAFVLGLAIAWGRPGQGPEAPAAGSPSAGPAPAAAPAAGSQPAPVAQPVTAPAPAAPGPAAARPAPADAVEYTVRPGDSLWSIAGRKYGNASLWREVAAANPDADPDRLVPGQSVRLPPITIRPQ
jgi:nucleoid-associated protein YgaU